MEQQTENDACSVEEKPGQQQASPPPAHISSLPLAAEKGTCVKLVKNLFLGYPALWCGLTVFRTQSVGKQIKTVVLEKTVTKNLKMKEKNSCRLRLQFCRDALYTCSLPVHILIFRFMKYRFKKKLVS